MICNSKRSRNCEENTTAFQNNDDLPKIAEAEQRLMYGYLPKTHKKEHNYLLYELYRVYRNELLRLHLIHHLHSNNNLTYQQAYVLDQAVPLLHNFAFL